MTEQRLTQMERWSLAVGSPVIAAGIIATAGTLWGLYNSQMQMQHQLGTLLDQAYLESQADRDLGQIEHRIDGLETRTGRLERRTERLEQRVLPMGERGGDS